MSKPLTLTGRQFGRLVVECRVGSRNQQSTWQCRCDCGRSLVVVSGSLRSGQTQSCGCLRKERAALVGAARTIDLTGKRFGRLVAQAKDRSVTDDEARWRCRCDCGRETRVRSSSLRNGTSQSCGCLRQELLCARPVKHGHTTHGKPTPEWDAWHSMKQRCLNPNHAAYANYGGRGISICQRWVEDFEAFLADVGLKPDPELTLDRIDNDGNYEPGNVRWATWSQQNSNQRRGNAA